MKQKKRDTCTCCGKRRIIVEIWKMFGTVMDRWCRECSDAYE